MSKKSQKIFPKTKKIKKKIIQKTPIYDNLQGNRNKTCQVLFDSRMNSRILQMTRIFILEKNEIYARIYLPIFCFLRSTDFNNLYVLFF